MNLSMRYLSDLVERMVKTFVQAYAGYWVTLGGADWDTLFTVNNLKVAGAATAMSVATSVLSKPAGNPDSASVLPPQAQPPAPQPVDPTLKPEDAAPPPPPPPPPPVERSAQEQLEELIELAKRIQPVALPPAPAPPPFRFARPAPRPPAGLEDQQPFPKVGPPLSATLAPPPPADH